MRHGRRSRVRKLAGTVIRREHKAQLDNTPTLHGTRACYYRLFLAQYLPKECDAFLYLDCDLIALCDVAPMFDQIPKFLAASFYGPVSASLDRAYFLEVGMRPDDETFNSGVMLFNAHIWRELDINFLLNTWVRPVMYGVDQCVLNAAFAHRTDALPWH